MSTVTTPPFTAAQCVAFVENSPLAVARKDRGAWMGLFARYSVVEDPVGSAPHISGLYNRSSGYRSRARLGAFYDTFIAPNEIQFEVVSDSVSGLQVMRDLTIQIDMSSQIRVHVPVHLLYELCIEEGELRILRLAAHWELLPMLQQQMASGWPFLRVGAASSRRLLRYLGLSGMLGFMRALRGVGQAGKDQTVCFAEYFNAGKSMALAGLFEKHTMSIVDDPGTGRKRPLEELAKDGGVVALSKVLAAGNIISASLHYQRGDSRYRGVALFELQRRSLRFIRVSFYWSV